MSLLRAWVWFVVCRSYRVQTRKQFESTHEREASRALFNATSWNFVGSKGHEGAQ